MDELLLLSGNDIPFPEARITIHQPKLKEIALIGEETFFTGCEFLNFSKDMLLEKDKVNLIHQTNFEILMSIVKDKSPLGINTKNTILMLLTLLFPEYEINIQEEGILLLKKNEFASLNKMNYDEFQKILVKMFCLDRKKKDEQDYNPGGDRAKMIAEKLKKGRQKAAAAKGEDNKKIAIFSRYISILSVGESKDINSFMNYTVYQLYDEFERFELKQNSDVYLQARLAGAQDLEEVDNWMKDIHS